MEYREIVLAKIASILSEGYFIKKKNGEFKRILKCSGLVELYTINETYLEPYSYNHYNGKTYENQNVEYDLFIGLDNIFTELYENNNIEGLLRLLKELGENVNLHFLGDRYADEKYEKLFYELNNLYQILGLSIEIENENCNVKHWSGTNEEKISDIFSVEKWLSENYLEVYKSYEGAITSYKSGHYGTCIEACRTTLTGLFSKFKSTEDFAKWLRGISIVSG